MFKFCFQTLKSDFSFRSLIDYYCVLKNQALQGIAYLLNKIEEGLHCVQVVIIEQELLMKEKLGKAFFLWNWLDSRKLDIEY